MVLIIQEERIKSNQMIQGIREQGVGMLSFTVLSVI